MKKVKLIYLLPIGLLFLNSCVSKKKLVDVQNKLEKANSDLISCGDKAQDFKDKLTSALSEIERQKQAVENSKSSKDEQLKLLNDQITDLKSQRDRQVEQVGNLTVLTKSANDNIEKTLSQLEKKDKYISLLQNAKTKADSINLALAVNLKGALKSGIDDQDVEIKVDKTVVMINLSDKMLYTSGSYKISPKANDVLKKIAAIIQSRPDFEVMVEGYTDNIAINSDCIEDNWDLSVKRATSVVRNLQKNFGVEPIRLIAAGRGEYSPLTENDTKEGRSANRRTRIIIMPKIDQFYDLLNPDKAAGSK